MSAGPDPSAILTSLVRSAVPASGLTAFGVNAHQKNAPDATLVYRMTTVGAKVARVDMVDWWPTVEWTGGWNGPKGVYDFSKSANLVSLLRSHNIKIVWLLTYNNPHYAPTAFSPVTPQSNIDAYIAYALATLNQYYRTGDLIELYNEPNLSYAWSPPNATQYATLMSQAAAAIRTAYPAATILTAGFSDAFGPGTWGPFMQTAANTGLTNLSGVAFHCYNGGDPYGQYPEAEASDYQTAQGIFGGMPIHITENGYRMQWASNSPQRQALLCARAYLLSIIMGAASYIHYDLFDDGVDQTNPEYTYGLFDAALVEKPSGSAMQSLFSAINNSTTYDFSFDTTQKLCWLTFYKPTGAVVIAWTFQQNANPVNFSAPIPGSAVASCKDLLGHVQPATLTGGILTMALTEAEGPVIVYMSP